MQPLGPAHRLQQAGFAAGGVDRKRAHSQLRRPRDAAAAAAASPAAPGPWPHPSSSSSRRGRVAAAATSPRPHGSGRSRRDERDDERPPQQQEATQRQHPAVATASFDSLLRAAQDAAESASDTLNAAGHELTRLQVWLGKPEAVLVREGAQLFCCLLFILLYIYSTYRPVVPGSAHWWLDLVLSLLFAADYAHRMLTASRHPLLAALHPLALIDLLSFAPSLLGALVPGMSTLTPWGLDLRWFRVFRALRLLRLSLLSGNLSTMKTNRGVLIAGNLNVPLVWLVASVVAWMFTSASCVAVMEKLPWHDALYFVGSTITTVGYGDVVVRSSMGRLFVLVMMLVGVVLIPVRASQLYRRLAERLLVAGHKPGDAPGCKGGYVVLSGRLSDVRGFNDFLQDFLVQVRNLSSAGSGRQALQLVCLCNKPSVEFLALQELHESNLTLVEGSAFSEQDLITRAGLSGSLGVMVLADRFSSNAAAEDTDVQFRVWAIKSAVKRLPLYVQVLRRSAVDVISPFLDPGQDVIMSVEGTRMRLLALSSLVPGSTTLITNLLRSSGVNAGFSGGAPPRRSSRRRAGDGGVLASLAGSMGGSPLSSRDAAAAAAAATAGDDGSRVPLPWQQQAPGGSNGSRASSSSLTAKLAGRRWLREYADGAHCELFVCPAGPPLAGLRFTGAAEGVYEASGALLVGLIEPKGQRLMLNPASHVLQQGQQLVVLAATRELAEAAAAGQGLEEALFTQALRAAEAGAAAAAAAAAATTHEQAVAHQDGPRVEVVQLPAAVLKDALDPGQHHQQQLADDAVQQQPSVAAAPAEASASGGNGSIGGGGSRAVKVRVPQLKEHDLVRASRDFDDGTGSSSSRSSSGAQGGRVSQHSVEQQPMLHHQPPSQQRPDAATAAAGAAFAGDAHYADAYAAFAQQQQQLASAAGTYHALLTQETDMEEDDEEEGELVPGCLAPWSGAFESDSLDETELCTDSELLEASLLQKQRQQRHADRQQRRQEQQRSASTSPSGSASAALAVNGSSNGSADGSAHQPHATYVLHQAPLPQQEQQPQRQTHTPQPGAAMLQPPQQLAGHFIVAGCASSFGQFARQLAASTCPDAEPLTMVLLHPDFPGPAIEEIQRLGCVSVYHVPGRSSDAAALVAAGAKHARSLVFLGPSERPTHMPVTAVSGVYGDPTSTREGGQQASDAAGSRTAVLADADGLASCYGVGEVFRPESLSTIVELGFTSSIRFLQPGLLLHGRPAPHSQGSYDEHRLSQGAALVTGLWAGLAQGLSRVVGSADGGGGEHAQAQQQQQLAAPAGGGGGGNTWLATGSPAATRTASPSHQQQQLQQQAQPLQQQQHHGDHAASSSSAAGAAQQPWLWRQQRQPQQPRSSYRHRKEIEEAGQVEGLTEWQLNSYYAAGRVMVPALLDVFTCQGFFKRQALLDLLAELAGDDGRPGGAMLQQHPVPRHLAGCTYGELVTHYLSQADPLRRHVPLGLLRMKAENRAWRLPYVATHPAPDTVLAATDCVFLIRPH